MNLDEFKMDEVGRWSEIKLEIITEYAQAYATILNSKNFKYYYIDAFAGAGYHLSKTSGEIIEGSPLKVLQIKPSFTAYHFIDLDHTKTRFLQKMTSQNADVHIHTEDCNKILLEKIFPPIKYEKYKRALCLLDPYGLHLDWEVIMTAGNMETFEIFLNFPVMDMQRNVLWYQPDKVQDSMKDRMNRFWGDDSWVDVAYDDFNLFNTLEKRDTIEVVKAFQVRLKEEAGFDFVPDPIPMRNSQNSPLYYLFFASQNKTGEKIVNDIFSKYGSENGY